LLIPYRLVFDVVRTSGPVEVGFVAFGSLLAVVLVALLALATFRIVRPEKLPPWLSKRPDRRGIGWFTIVFLVLLCAGVGLAVAREVTRGEELKYRTNTGAYSTLEGCLSAFHPGRPGGGRSIDSDERWVLHDHEFDYGQGEIRYAFHTTEPEGGPVHADSAVRVSFINDDFYQRDDIVRLDVADHACARAQDPGPRG
jgi:hypothetical protein